MSLLHLTSCHCRAPTRQSLFNRDYRVTPDNDANSPILMHADLKTVQQHDCGDDAYSIVIDTYIMYYLSIAAYNTRLSGI